MATSHFEEHPDSLNQEVFDLEVPKTHDDVLSLNSSSLCFIEAIQANLKTKAPEVDKSGPLAHLHHGSPLESITELAEVEDSSEHRSPGDGEIRIMKTNIRRASVSTDGRCDILNSNEHLNVGNLETMMMDTCVYTSEVPEHQPSSSNSCSRVLEVQLDSQSCITPQQDIQETPDELLYPQNSSDHNATLNNGAESGEEVRSGMSDGQKCDYKEQNLIEILTTCEAKVEQLEQLKYSSFHLSDQVGNMYNV